MKEIRDLIIHLSKDQKKTIFLSSHILYEVELVANRMIIINNGTAQVEGYVSDLLNSSKLKVTVEVNDSEKAKSLLSNTNWVDNIQSIENNKIILMLHPEEVSVLNKFLVENEIDVNALIPARSLEEYFLSIMEKASK